MTAADELLPVLLTADELAELREVLEHVNRFDHGGYADESHALLNALENREVQEPDYDYCLAGPWGTIKAGDGSLEATIAGCRDARREHWAEGHGRDYRYDQIQVERIATRYVHDDQGEPLGWFTSEAVEVPVPDAPLTDAEQAESDRRVEAAARSREALYAHLRERATKS